MKPLLVADLFCGAGGSSSGARRALAARGLRMDLVAVDHWSIAVETHSRNHPDAQHFCVDVYRTRPLDAIPGGRLDLLMASPTCFPAGALILTDDGLKPIEDVSTMDRVLTHRGRWRRVTATASRPADTVIVRGQGHYGLETTAEHPFYARQRRALHRRGQAGGFRYLGAEWRAAGSLAGCMWATPVAIDAVERPAAPLGMTFTPDFWWFVGRWLADGFVSIREERGSEVLIACGPKKAEATAARLGGTALAWNQRPMRTAVRFEARHAPLAAWLVEQFGEYAHGKRLPTWALTLPEVDRRALLDGYLSGDGCLFRSRERDHVFRSACSVSRQLAIGMRLLAASLGHRPLLHLQPARPGTVIEGRAVETRDQYEVKWTVEPKRIGGPPTDAHLWQKVRDVAPGRVGVEVFNLQVEEDESYVADGIVVHNCTYFSRARGGKPISRDQRYGRMTPTQVIRWLTELRVRCLLVENVPEFISWGPVDRATGRPVRAKAGMYFRAWVRRIERLGFKVEWKVLNAADFGGATTRERFFLLGRSDGRPITWPAPSHSKAGASDLFGAGAKRWRAAREIIDWALPGRSIFTRKRPLSPKTLARIYAGAVKFAWPEPFLVILRQHMTAQGIDVPLPTICAGGTHIGLAQPVVLRTGMHRSNALCVRDAGQPIPTVTTDGGLAVAQPVVFQVNQGQDRARNMRGVDEPLQTVVTRPSLGVAEPIILPQRNDAPARSVEDPVPTIVTVPRVYVAEPFVIGNRNNATGKGVSTDPVPTATTAPGGGVALVEPFVLAQGSNGAPRATSEPVPSILTAGKHALIEPFVLSQGAGGAPREVADPVPTIPARGAHALIAPYYGTGAAAPVDRPLPTVTTKDRFGLAVPFISPYYGAKKGKPRAARGVDEPLPTQGTENRFGLAQPFIAPFYKSSVGASVDAPTPTVTTMNKLGLVTPVTHDDSSSRARSVDEPVPTITGAARGELAFIAAAFGERHGQAPRVHSVEEPTPTLCATGRVQLVEGADAYDILFRMLEPRELARAMGFSDDEVEYEFAGTKTDVTRQIGNAVSVEQAAALVGALFDAEAAGARRRAGA